MNKKTHTKMANNGGLYILKHGADVQDNNDGDDDKDLLKLDFILSNISRLEREDEQAFIWAKVSQHGMHVPELTQYLCTPHVAVSNLSKIMDSATKKRGCERLVVVLKDRKEFGGVKDVNKTFQS